MLKNVVPQDSHNEYNAVPEVYQKGKFSEENNFLVSGDFTKR